MTERWLTKKIKVSHRLTLKMICCKLKLYYYYSCTISTSNNDPWMWIKATIRSNWRLKLIWDHTCWFWSWDARVSESNTQTAVTCHLWPEGTLTKHASSQKQFIVTDCCLISIHHKQSAKFELNNFKEERYLRTGT